MDSVDPEILLLFIRAERCQRPSMKIKVKKWHMVGYWSWNINQDVCGICQQAFDACCPTCKFPGDACIPVWGHCNHPFHMHCIIKWLQTQNARHQCPLCRQPWKFRGEREAKVAHVQDAEEEKDLEPPAVAAVNSRN